MKKHYAEVLGKEPEIKVIHAGLECGLLKEHYPNIEIDFCGANYFAMRIRLMKKSKSQLVQTYWELLTKVLADIK